MTGLFALQAVSQENLVGDASFENEGQAQWLDHSWGPQYVVEWDAMDQAHGGKSALKLVATQITDVPNRYEMAGARQIFPVKPGDMISGGGWLAYDNLKGVEVYMECKWLDENQQELGTGIGTPHKTAGSGKWEYQNLETWSAQERTAPKDAAFVDLRLILLSAGNADKATGTAWWDDVQFTIRKK